MAEVGRNDPCPCDSGKKYKQCCLPEKAVRWIVVHHQRGHLRGPEGRILVFRALQHARRAVQRRIPSNERPQWLVGALGASNWEAFKDAHTHEGERYWVEL